MKTTMGISKIAQWLKLPATKLDGISSLPCPYIVEKDNHFS